jgi:predicted phosphodiesterase
LKIAVISDTHTGMLFKDRTIPYEIPDADVLIHTGDLDCYDDKDWIQFCLWFENLPHKYKLVTPGNHDFLIAEWYAKGGLERECGERDFCMLIDGETTIDGVKFYGSPWVPWCGNWAFQYIHQQAQSVWQEIPKDTDVLITHTPPYGILDVGGFGSQRQNHLGSGTLLKTIFNIPLKAHVFGHIHENAGVEKKNGALFVNACVVDGQYKPNGKQFVFEVNK